MAPIPSNLGFEESVALTDVHIRNAKATESLHTERLRGLVVVRLSPGPQGLASPLPVARQAVTDVFPYFGTYPELSLRDAQVMRVEARALIAKGISASIVRSITAFWSNRNRSWTLLGVIGPLTR